MRADGRVDLIEINLAATAASFQTCFVTSTIDEDSSHRFSSGVSIRQFCAKERVSEPSFYSWRRKLAGRKSGQRGSQLANRNADDSRSRREFIPLRLLDVAGALELIHPLGYRIRVTGEVNVGCLQRILDVLDGRSGT